MAVNASEPSRTAQASGMPQSSRIGEDLIITGNVSSKGEIHLDGVVKGDINCVSLVLGENSKLEGSVIAKDVVLRGRLIGSIQAQRVTLQSGCHLEGDVFHQSLAMEQGAYFEGQSRRSDNSLSPSRNAQVSLDAVEPKLVAEPADQGKGRPTVAFVRNIA
jgi:cytoskeletal protein CcmA (bactofilin family)